MDHSLFERGADACLRDYRGKSALGIALDAGHEEEVTKKPVAYGV